MPWVLLKPSSGVLRFTSTYFSHVLTGSCVRREDLVEVKKKLSPTSFLALFLTFVILPLVPMAKSMKLKEKSCTWM